MRKTKQSAPLNVVRYLRTFHGLTIGELCEKSGLSYSTILHMEQGCYGKIGSVRKIANFFGVSLDCIVRNRFEGAVSAIAQPPKRAHRRKDLLRAKNIRCEEIGDTGEQLVLNWERARLAGTPFAYAVNGNYSDDLEAGFDILSFDDNGMPVYIEVKTTVGGAGTPFYMTRAERAFMESCVESGLTYRLYYLYELKDEGECQFKIYTPKELARFSYEPVDYIVKGVIV